MTKRCMGFAAVAFAAELWLLLGPPMLSHFWRHEDPDLSKLAGKWNKRLAAPTGIAEPLAERKRRPAAPKQHSSRLKQASQATPEFQASQSAPLSADMSRHMEAGLQLQISTGPEWVEFLQEHRIQLAVAASETQGHRLAYLFRVGDGVGDMMPIPANARLLEVDRRNLAAAIELLRMRGAGRLGLTSRQARLFTVYTSRQFAFIERQAAARWSEAGEPDGPFRCAWRRSTAGFELMRLE